MLSDLEIENEIEALLHHDFHIELQKEVYQAELNGYECMLLNLISISRYCIEHKLYKPSILLFGYDKKVICNQYFNINYEDGSSLSNTNIRLEFIIDHNNERVYYMLQSIINPKNVIFHWLTYSVPFNDWKYIDYNKMLVHIIEEHEFREKTEVINCEIITHDIDFETGEWIIQEPLV